MRSVLIVFFLTSSLIALSSSSTATCIFNIIPGSSRYACALSGANFSDPNDDFVIEGEHLADKSDEDVQNLFTSNSILKFIPQQIFDRFPNLLVISIADAGLQELHQPWRNCSRLQNIEFSTNPIEIIPEGIFEACEPNTISFWQASIREIHPLAFKGLQFLLYLSIKSNLVAFPSFHPDTFIPTENLITLIVDDVGLETIHPSTFHPLKKLNQLELTMNPIKVIQEGTFIDLPVLHYLLLRNNSQLIEFQSSAFSSLPELEYLDLSNGNLPQLNKSSFGMLENLRTFLIRNQKLAEIERNFFDDFLTLRWLDLRENVCVDQELHYFDRNEMVAKSKELLEECYWRWEGSPETTAATSTPGATSSIRLSIGLIALITSYQILKCLT